MKHFLFKRTGFFMLFLGFLLCTVQICAQYTATPFESGNQYTALTKDNSNNVYGVRLNHTSGKGEVVKIAPGSTTPTVIYGNLVFEAGTSQIYPWGIAVNSAGDVFVTSANQPVGWQIVKLTYPSYAATVIQTGKYYSALAVDAGNNLYAMEYNSATTTYQLVRYTAGAESSAGTPVWNGVTYPSGGSATYPWGIVFDSQNNIYLLDFWENSGGRLLKLTAPDYTSPTVLSTNKSFSALAIDGSNNIYTIEGVNATTARVMKYADPAAAGTALYSSLTAAPLFYAWGLAVTSDGKVFVGDAAAASNGRLVQLAPPGITVSSVNRVSGASTNASSVQYTVTFSSAATNVTTSSFSLTTTGALTGAGIASVSGSGTTYTVTVNTGTGDGTIRLDVNGSGISPSVTNVPFTTGQVYTIDRTAPVTTITATPALVTNSAGASFSFTSNEAGGIFEASLDGGAYSAAASPATFVGLAEGSHTFSVRAIDAAGNVDASPETYTWTIDITAPVVTSVNVPAAGWYNIGGKLDFTVNYSENIVVNTTAGSPYITLALGSSVVNALYTGSTATTMSFSYTVVSGDMDMDGIIVGNLTLNGSTIKDEAGNNSNLTLFNVPNTSGVRVNTTTPTVTISSTATSPLTGPFTVTITFSEAMTGFTATDITTTNATAGTLSTTDNITYTVQITPTASAVSVNVPANVAQNPGNNGNSASNTLSYVYDITPPVITSVAVPANGYYKAGDVLNFTVTFNEDIQVGGTHTLPVIIGSTTVQAGYLYNSSNSITYSYTVQAGEMDMDGIALGASLQLNGSIIRDMAGNDGNLTINNAGNTNGVFVNTNIPSVVVGGSISLNAPSTVNFVFSEAVTGFAVSDIALTNATAGNLQTTDNITYTALITPTAQGGVSIQVPANVTVNIGGNGNAASNTFTYLYDPNPPVITSVSVPVNGYYKAGDVLSFTVNFNETVRITNTPTLPVTLNSSAVQATYVSGTNTNALVFSYTVQNGDMDMDGIAPAANLQLNSGTIKDVSGNDANLTLNGTGNTSNVFVNTTHATVTLSTTAAARVNAPFTITVTFSEAVTGLTTADFTATNATVSNLQTTDNITYTVLITPAADGSVSIQLPADAAVNIGNNGTQASNTITITRDATAPVITAAQNFSILQNSTAGTQIGQVLATDASGIIQSYSITSDPTGGAFMIDATGMISVKDGAILNNNIGSTINVLITVSDGLNTSTAAAVAIKINAINKAPVLDAINNVTLCATTNSNTIQLTGASAVEPTQTYTLSIASNQAYFDVLTVNTAGLITYKLKPNVTAGVASITVTIKDDGGTANGGVDTYQRSFTITVNPLPVVTITSDKGNTISKGDIAHLTATGGATYKWDANSSILSGQQSAIAEVRPQANITYQVTATSNAGCISTASISIAIIEDFKVDATNVLTPNGDGKNDKWVIRNIDSYPDNELKIFDRSGRLVFSQRNYNNTWDGKVNGNPLAEGTYYYFLSISGGAKTAKGFITIILKAN
jgi:gliding motility-associated-like protein